MHHLQPKPLALRAHSRRLSRSLSRLGHRCAAPPPVFPRPAALRSVASPALPAEALGALASETEAVGFPAAIYVGLGTTAALFLATFFVAPSFKAAFKEASPVGRANHLRLVSRPPRSSPGGTSTQSW